MEQKKTTINKEELFKELDNRDSIDNQLNIAWIISTYKCAKSTAETYYYQWKKEYLKRKNPPGTKEEATKEQSSLTVMQMIVEGENGTYTVCKCGVELRKDELVMFFENIEQLNSFAEEYRQAFSLMK